MIRCAAALTVLFLSVPEVAESAPFPGSVMLNGASDPTRCKLILVQDEIRPPVERREDRVSLPKPNADQLFTETQRTRDLERRSEQSASGSDKLYIRARGLPPEGLYPPVENVSSLKEGPASRPSEAEKGGKSLFDVSGGEWRYFPEDNWHYPHWDYNAHDRLKSPWQNIQIGKSPARKS